MTTLKSKQELREQVREFFQKEILPELPAYEAQRKQDKFVITILIVCFVGFGLAALSPIFLFLPLCMLPFMFFSKRKTVVINGDYEMKIKTKYMKKFLSIFGDYKWSKFATAAYRRLYPVLHNLKIFPKTMFLLLDDTISGAHEGVSIEIAEVRTGIYANSIVFFVFLLILSAALLTPFFVFLFIIVLSLGDANVVMGFLALIAFLFLIVIPAILIRNACVNQSMKGVLVKLTMPKRFNKETFLYENKISSQKLVHKRSKNYEKVVLEDIDFNKNYTVFSQDQVEARYLLTTAFIERFKNLQVAFQADYQRAEFKDNHLFILLGTKRDLFKMGSLNESTSYSHFNQMFEEIYSVLSLVEYFKLNQDIGL